MTNNPESERYWQERFEAKRDDIELLKEKSLASELPADNLEELAIGAVDATLEYATPEQIAELLRIRYERNKERIEELRARRRRGELTPDDLDQLAKDVLAQYK